MNKILTTFVTVAAGAAITLSAPLSPASANSSGQQALADRYATLSGALISSQAHNQKVSLRDYLRSSQASVYTLPDAPSVSRLSILQAPGASSILGTRLQATDVADLNSELVSLGVGFSQDDYSDITALAQAVKTKSGSVDAQVTAAGAVWAAQLQSLAAGALSAPDTPQTPASASVPAGALSFGLLVNKSLTRLAMDSPKLFNQVKSSGVGTEATRQAWSSALADAWAGSSQDLSSVIPDACTGGLLSVVATGQPSAANGFGDCGPGCKAAGQYLHSQVEGLFAPPDRENQYRPVKGDGYDPNAPLDEQRQNLPGVLATALEPDAADDYASTLDTMLINNGDVCNTASVTTKDAMSAALPGVWSSLQTP